MQKMTFVDKRNASTTVYDKDGNAHTMTRTNAREMVRHAGWTDFPPATVAQTEADVSLLEGLAPEDVVIGTNTGNPFTPPTALTAGVDLTHLLKADLLAAAKAMGLDIHGRSSEKKIIAQMDEAADAALVATGDFDAPPVVEADDAPEVVAAKQAKVDARRRAGYLLFASKHGVPYAEESTLTDIVKGLSTLTPATGE